MINNVGLILEGGGMRGVYTSGVLEFFMENDLYFPYVIGVSAGACNATSYISKQKGRNKEVNINYINDSRYLSYKNLIRRKGLFGMDFIFKDIPTKFNVFDFKTFKNAKEKFIIGATNCETGEPIYFDKNECYEDVLDVIRASSSLPIVSPMVKYKNFNLLDGGISDPIPIKKSIEDGNTKNVVILTRNKGYIKKPFKNKLILKLMYSKYNKLIDTMMNRYKLYNETIEYIENLEKENKVFVIRPKNNLSVNRIERNAEKLKDLYNQGFNEAKEQYEKLKDWLK